MRKEFERVYQFINTLEGIEGLVPEGPLRGMNMALKVCHEDRTMNYQEALEVRDAARWHRKG